VIHSVASEAVEQAKHEHRELHVWLESEYAANSVDVPEGHAGN
jgi:hypothetical protein